MFLSSRSRDLAQVVFDFKENVFHLDVTFFLLFVFLPYTLMVLLGIYNISNYVVPPSSFPRKLLFVSVINEFSEPR